MGRLDAHSRVADRADLLKRQQQERRQLKQAWAEHDTARKTGWATYAQQRTQQTTEQAVAPAHGPRRTRDTRDADRFRRADAGRGMFERHA